jgi:hypothetical protein
MISARNMQKLSNFTASVAVVLALFSIAGCGRAHPELVPVSGQVTLDGKPLTVGQITVYPEGRRASFGKFDSEGRFSLMCYEPGDGAPVGQHIATVTAVENLDEHTLRWYAPKKYAGRANGVWVTIDGSTDDLKIDLTWAGSGQTGPYHPGGAAGVRPHFSSLENLVGRCNSDLDARFECHTHKRVLTWQNYLDPDDWFSAALSAKFISEYMYT